MAHPKEGKEYRDLPKVTGILIGTAAENFNFYSSIYKSFILCYLMGMHSMIEEYPSRENILLLLKNKGPLSVNELTKELNITRSAIRKHLIFLEGKGLVCHAIKRQIIGRPTLLYKLTEKAFCFSRKASDRRREERIKKNIFVVLDYQGQHLEAESTDFSKKGLGITIFGETPLAAGETVMLTTSYLRIKAKVIWMNKLIDQSLIGLQRIN
jgi:predicted transcriptional regulator